MTVVICAISVALVLVALYGAIGLIRHCNDRRLP